MFVPTALKRKKGGNTTRVNAAPSAGGEVEMGTGSTDARPDLMGALREKLGPMADVPRNSAGDVTESLTKKQKIEKSKDDYDRFMEEIGGMLGAGSGS